MTATRDNAKRKPAIDQLVAGAGEWAWGLQWFVRNSMVINEPGLPGFAPVPALPTCNTRYTGTVRPLLGARTKREAGAASSRRPGRPLLCGNRARDKREQRCGARLFLCCVWLRQSMPKPAPFMDVQVLKRKVTKPEEPVSLPTPAPSPPSGPLADH